MNTIVRKNERSWGIELISQINQYANIVTIIGVCKCLFTNVLAMRVGVRTSRRSHDSTSNWTYSSSITPYLGDSPYSLASFSESSMVAKNTMKPPAIGRNTHRI